MKKTVLRKKNCRVFFVFVVEASDVKIYWAKLTYFVCATPNIPSFLLDICTSV